MSRRRILPAERRARLVRGHRLDPADRAPSLPEAARAVVALHATEQTSVGMSARARVDGLARADVDHALTVERSVVKTVAMRRTLWVVHRDDVATVVGATGPRAAAAIERDLRRDIARGGRHPDAAAWLARLDTAVRTAVADGAPRSLAELRAVVADLDDTRALSGLAARGHLVRADVTAGRIVAAPRWADAGAWLGAPIPPVDETVARTDVVRNWLRAFGPGTDADVAWWLGDTLGHARQALAAIGAVAVDLDEGIGWVLADDVDEVPAVAPSAALLPALDPATMGWKHRDWYLGEHRSALFDTAGNGGATAWWDGRIVGAWHQRRGDDVELLLLDDPGIEARRALDVEAARLTTWLAGDRPGGRWPAPAVAALSG